MDGNIIVAILVSAGIPSALFGFAIRRFEKKLEKSEKEKAENEDCKQEMNILLIRSVMASISLGEAAAIALKKGKTNGETEAALNYSREIKSDIENFLIEQGTKKIL